MYGEREKRLQRNVEMYSPLLYEDLSICLTVCSERYSNGDSVVIFIISSDFFLIIVS